MWFPHIIIAFVFVLDMAILYFLAIMREYKTLRNNYMHQQKNGARFSSQEHCNIDSSSVFLLLFICQNSHVRGTHRV